MDSVIRGAIVYLFLLIIFRISGKRTMAQVTSFDMVVLLIISETTQQAMVTQDQSMTNAFLLIMTLVGLSVLFSWLKLYSHRIENWLDGTPVVLIEKGRMHANRMHRERIGKEDILEAARMTQGLKKLDQIEYAVLERTGEISVIPKNSGDTD